MNMLIKLVSILLILCSICFLYTYFAFQVPKSFVFKKPMPNSQNTTDLKTMASEEMDIEFIMEHCGCKRHLKGVQKNPPGMDQ